MSRADYLKLGDNNAICDACGKKFKASELRKRWDGFWVCARDWEPRQPQDFVRGVRDQQKPAVVRDEGADSFIVPNQGCTPTGSSSVAGFSVAGCWVAGKPLPPGYIV